LLQQHGPSACIFAGGTDVLVRVRAGRLRPSIVIDVKAIDDLSADITRAGERVRIGARVTMSTIARDLSIREEFPALAEAAAVVGSVQIRNRATLAGNVCNASPAADTAPVLLAYGAAVTLVGPAGTRMVALSEFFLGPGRTARLDTEIVQSIEIPVGRGKRGTAFGRITRRFGVDLATVNLCCHATADGEVRVAFGAVAPRPFVVRQHVGPVEMNASDAWKSRVIDRAIGEASPISDVRGSREYRLAMLQVLGRRTLDAALARLVAR